ncbi:MAG: hypothetical protein WC405_01400 [Syntrophales bacterium]
MRIFISALFILICSGLAYGDIIASFDCKKAKTQDEKFICSDESVATLDSKLTGLYKLSLKVVKPNQSIIKQQTEWLRNIRSQCNDLNCISRVYSVRIAEISDKLNEHTKPIPRIVIAEKKYPSTKSPYCRAVDGGSNFIVNINCNGTSISGNIDGIYDCGRKVWGPIDVKGQVTGNIVEVNYEGGFSGEGWAKAYVIISGSYLYWQIYQELRIESYEPDSETLKIKKKL